jgi:hypothetical protein
MRAASLVAATLLGLALGGCGGESRQDEVARKGAEVMPFDLDRTTHDFAKRPDGGIQTVLADEQDDEEQVRLVREHLRREAEAFRRGEFDDPAAIHGDAMPGLAALRASAGRIEIAYADVPAGARLRYATGEARLVRALHAWFDAQVVDHGEHADVMTETGG